jgi:hypothetical protein
MVYNYSAQTVVSYIRKTYSSNVMYCVILLKKRQLPLKSGINFIEMLHYRLLPLDRLIG